MNSTVAPNTPADHQLRLIVESYARVSGRLLIAENSDTRAALWNLPAVIVAHGIEPDPIFFYGNRAALTLFEMDFAAFTKLPSRFSAEPLARDERAALLQRVSRDGFIDDYAGVRISSSGRRFLIEQAVVWNLIDTVGAYHGQAATFGRWTQVSG